MKKLVCIILIILSSLQVCAQSREIDSLRRELTQANDTTRVTLYGRIALEYDFRVEFDSAKMYIDTALLLSEKVNYPYGIAQAKDILGVVYFDEGKMDSSLACYLDATKFFETNNDYTRLANMYDKIGQIYGITERFDYAKIYYEKALALLPKITDYRTQANAYNGMGSYYINFADYLARVTPDSTQAIESNFRQSIPYLNNAATYFEKAGYERGTAYVFGNLAFVETALHDNTKAIEYSLRALRFFEENDLKSYLVISYNQIGDLYSKEKNFPLALAYANKALALMDDVQNDYDRSNTYGLLSSIYESMGNYKEALKFARLQHDTAKNVFDKEKEEQIGRIQAQFDTEKKEQENLLLKKEAELNQATIKRQGYVTAIVIGALIVMGIISVLTYRNLVVKKKFAVRLSEISSAQARWFTNIAHELRTPLTLILGPIESILESDNSLSNSTKQEIKMASKNGEHLLKMVNEILDISRMETGEIRLHVAPTNITSLLRQIAASFHSYAEQKQIKIEVAPSETICLNVDGDKISNILINLVSNALKFTHAGGSVTLSVRDDSNKENVLIEVIDTGEGIPAKDLPMVFERFYQVEQPGNRNVGGSGVGLALCKELAQLHGGKMEATSMAGQGSTFALVMPSLLKVVPQEETPEISAYRVDDVIFSYEENGNENGHEAKILIVEDNPDMRAYLTKQLNGSYHVEQAFDGIDAIDKLRSFTPDLIISDLMMPRMDGLEFAQYVKDSDPFKSIPFITLTARADDRDKITALRYGVDDYILKPFNPAELKVRVDNLITNYLERRTAQAEVEDVVEEIVTYDDRVLIQLQEQVHQSLENSQFSVKDLADFAAMSESTLHRFIKKMTGMSPGQFIREIRLQRALTLLETRQYKTIAEVVMAVGFENNAHFSSLFKKRFGKSPSALAN